MNHVFPDYVLHRAGLVLKFTTRATLIRHRQPTPPSVTSDGGSHVVPPLNVHALSNRSLTKWQTSPHGTPRTYERGGVSTAGNWPEQDLCRRAHVVSRCHNWPRPRLPLVHPNQPAATVTHPLKTGPGPLANAQHCVALVSARWSRRGSRGMSALGSDHAGRELQ